MYMQLYLTCLFILRYRDDEPHNEYRSRASWRIPPNDNPVPPVQAVTRLLKWCAGFHKFVRLDEETRIKIRRWREEVAREQRAAAALPSTSAGADLSSTNPPADTVCPMVRSAQQRNLLRLEELQQQRFATNYTRWSEPQEADVAVGSTVRLLTMNISDNLIGVLPYKFTSAALMCDELQLSLDTLAAFLAQYAPRPREYDVCGRLVRPWYCNLPARAYAFETEDGRYSEHTKAVIDRRIR